MSGEKIEVWLDADFVAQPIQVGTLAHDRGHIRFNYTDGWLTQPSRFDIDPDLSLDGATFHPNPELGNFGIFLDSSPDCWGQVLMKRREALEASDAHRPPRHLYAWDYLIGVQDLTRQGALRFRYEGTDVFLSDHRLSAPPVSMLAELEEVAHALSSKRLNDLDDLRRWLSVLVAPGASLGGARPKANFTDTDGSLWIAKFPARDDVIDVGRWEWLTHQLATSAGVTMSPAKCLRLTESHHTFCTRRFDRLNGRRIFYASAMTMLRKSVSEGTGYPDIAQFLLTNGVRQHVRQDLAQLFRRVVFNVAVGNRDDHLRNHGFILTQDGWRIAPAFDLNPNIDKAEHVLNIDDSDNRPSIENLLASCGYYDLAPSMAQQIVAEVLAVVRQWSQRARALRLPAAEIQLMAAAFISA